MRSSLAVDRASVTRFPQARQSRAAYLAVVYVALCLVLSLLAFVPQDSNPGFFYVVFVVMLPVSFPVALFTYIGGLIIFGPGDWPTWARVTEALVWTAFAAVQAVGILYLCRTRRTQPQPD